MGKAKAVYKRVLLKISGEGFARPGHFGIDPDQVQYIASEAAQVHALGVELAMVVGGGNMIRGQQIAEHGISRTTGDTMGMLATVINALALQHAIESQGIETRLLTAFNMQEVAEPFIRRRALRHLEKKRVVIFAAGTGNPFFTTDTCAALRASELDADLLIKATKVDGVYSDDPMINSDAELFDKLSYDEVLTKKLKIMDQAAISLCSNNNIPIIVLNIFEKGNITKAICDERVGTLIGCS